MAYNGGGWAKCPEGAFWLQPSIIAEVTLHSTHYFGELLSFGPQAEASHIRPPMNRNVPTKAESEASFRFIVIGLPEVRHVVAVEVSFNCSQPSPIDAIQSQESGEFGRQPGSP